MTKEQLKRNFINYVLEKKYNLSTEYEDGTLVNINVRDENNALIVNLNFSDDFSSAPILIGYTEWISTDTLDDLTALFKKISKLYKDLDDDRGNGNAE